MAYGDFKDLTSRAASDKMFRDKAFNNAKNSKNDRYQTGLTLIVYTFWVKKTSGGAARLAWSQTLAMQNKSTTKN